MTKQTQEVHKFVEWVTQFIFANAINNAMQIFVYLCIVPLEISLTSLFADCSFSWLSFFISFSWLLSFCISFWMVRHACSWMRSRSLSFSWASCSSQILSASWAPRSRLAWKWAEKTGNGYSIGRNQKKKDLSLELSDTFNETIIKFRRGDMWANLIHFNKKFVDVWESNIVLIEYGQHRIHLIGFLWTINESGTIKWWSNRVQDASQRHGMPQLKGHPKRDMDILEAGVHPHSQEDDLEG